MQSSTNQNLTSRNSSAAPQPLWPWLSLKAGLLYFAMVFGVGCVLGPIRILWAVPQFGVRMSELLEMPIMLVAVLGAAHWVTKQLAVPPVLGPRLTMGLAALACLLGAEWGLVLRLRGLSMVEYISTRDPVAGTAYYIMLCLFAVMPWLIALKDKD